MVAMYFARTQWIEFLLDLVNVILAKFGSKRPRRFREDDQNVNDNRRTDGQMTITYTTLYVGWDKKKTTAIFFWFLFLCNMDFLHCIQILLGENILLNGKNVNSVVVHFKCINLFVNKCSWKFCYVKNYYLILTNFVGVH